MMTILLFGCFLSASAFRGVTHHSCTNRFSTSLRASTDRRSSSFVVEVAKSAKSSLVKIDLFGPRGSRSGTGTGIIYDLDKGLIVTNAHVAGVSRETTITLADGTALSGVELVGRAKDCDIALLRCDEAEWKLSRKIMKKATFGKSSDLELGEYAVACGYCGGEAEFMTTVGIVSGLTSRKTPRSVRRRPNRRPEQAESDKEAKSSPKDATEEASAASDPSVPVILTDAALSFGNSGGPLLNEWGEVVGMNTFIEMRPSSIGVSIAIEHVESEVARILAKREELDSAGPSTRSLVYLYNDPMNKRSRVEAALAKVFGWEASRANEVMMEAHTRGRARCGEWASDEAEKLCAALGDEDLLAETEPAEVSK